MLDNNWQAIKATPFTLRIVTCGYEERARYVLSQHSAGSARTLVLDYQCHGSLDYDANRSFFSEQKDTAFISIDGDLAESLASSVKSAFAALEDPDSASVLFDVSSCSRSTIATVLLVLSTGIKTRVRLTFAYALSAFDEPPTGELPSHISEPVVGDLAGWSDDLSKPPCAIIGLGFEPGRALGCIDYLEIPEVRLFMPYGIDARFVAAVLDANALLIEQAGKENVLPYDVTDPSITYQKLESLVHGLIPIHRPVLIPLGPKIFAALSILLALRMNPLVCVWRTSSGVGAHVKNQKAEGTIAIFTTELKSDEFPMGE